jgi:hypothetical protein
VHPLSLRALVHDFGGLLRDGLGRALSDQLVPDVAIS